MRVSLRATGTEQTLLGVAGWGDDAVAVGTGGAIVAWRRGTWSMESSPTSENLYAVTCDEDTLVAVGGNLHVGGNSSILSRPRSGGWTAEPSGMQHVLLAVTRAADRWVAGGYNGGLVAGEPGAFEVLEVAHYQHVFALASLGFKVFAAGLGGSVIELEGTRYLSHDMGLGVHVRALAVSREGNLYAAGLNGIIACWDQLEWRSMSSSTQHHLEGIWMASDHEGYAVGYAGTIVAWDGKRWSTRDSGTSANLHAVHGIADQVIAVGSRGIALHLPRAGYQ